MTQHSAQKPALFGITGWKNSGKTTLTEKLVSELSRRGWRISTVKHAHHSFDIDHQGTDSFRHREAGANEVAIVSGHRWALMHELRGEQEPALDDIIARMAPCDLILIEGYKTSSHPKIEVRRRDSPTRTPLDAAAFNIVAIASDTPIEEQNLPQLPLNDVDAIADYITDFCGLAAHG